MTVIYASLTDCGISQVSANCSGIVVIPPLITDISPSTIPACLHSSLKLRASIHKSDVTILAHHATDDSSIHVVSTHRISTVVAAGEVGFTTSALEVASNDAQATLSICSTRNSNVIYNEKERQYFNTYQLTDPF